MANRSYLYALNGEKHISLGENPYTIPYAYQVLAAYDNESVESHLYDKIVGITADFNRGKEALYYLLDFLCTTGQMEDHAAFEEQVAATKQFLDTVSADRILLENGEIYALYTDDAGKYLDGPGLEKANSFAREDYTWIGEDINNLKELNIQPANLFSITDESFLNLFKWVIDLRGNWKDQLGIDSWRSILYYQFTEQ